MAVYLKWEQIKFAVIGKKDWVEPVNLYALIVADPSEMKSTALKLFTSAITAYAVLANSDEKKLIDNILKANDESKNKSVKKHEKTIRESKNRIREIDGLLQNLYEDKVAGEITSDLFKRMS